MCRWTALCIVLLCLGLVSIAFAGTLNTVRMLDKKLIEYGWDVPFPDYIRDNIREMEKRPFDGLIFKLHGGGRVLEPEPWDESKFQADYEALRAIRWRRFTDNFVIMWAASKQDWFNDEHWRAIEHNVRLVARAARVGRCKGVCFDPEPYGPNPWAYSQAAHRDSKSFEEYEAMVRRRGAQFIRAIEREFPGVHFMTLFQLSVLSPLLRSMDPQERAQKLSRHHYGLLPAFFNGMLEAASDKVIFTDGNEGAYYYTKSEQHFSAYHRITQQALLLVYPGLWPKYRRQVRAGQALYIDQYFGLRKRKVLGHYMKPDERAKWFEHNVYWALYTTDKYVWCYSERMNWWKGQNIPPGCEEAIRSARRKLASGQGLGFDLRPIVEAAKARERAELQRRLKRQAAAIRRLKGQRPVIDARLDDEAWQAATKLGPFLPLATAAEQQVQNTTAWAVWDEAALYIAVRCAEPKPKKMRLCGNKRDDDVWVGDDVEVLIRTPDQKDAFYHFMINPAGVVWDSINRAGSEDRSYNPTWHHAASVGSDFWAAEMAIPWKILGLNARPGLQLRANICRQRSQGHELSAWSPMARGFLEPEFFGTWTLSA